ncbi:S-layer homology domain-containing protein [Alkalihalophilus pseudofirmus]|uniref:S-layer homology domain-containing protein n=1 Tax=Alkalihalophilus pseudofirmus TaxID=79885 RepID=A0AAJ2U368_ALKPS|nr:S-layer homology domain-containing protein [Alkalihalophilus pseudofirmus]MDV2886336.1 S-layer homology domain-containing protein [Alkalihalophilus pseudofirmus]
MKHLRVMIILIICLSFMTTTVYGAKTFNDVDGQFWAKKEIDYLANQSIISGYPDGSFKPNQTVTRSQAASMIVKALGLSTEGRPDISFRDVEKDFHAYRAIAAIVDEGIMRGSGDLFRPNETLTRGQMAAVLDRAFKLNPFNEEIYFKDITNDYIFYRSIQNLAANGITAGYSSDHTFRPNTSTSRAQFSVFVARALDESFKVDPATGKPDDRPEQIIVVSTSSLASQQATLRTYERKNGKLERAFSPMPAVVGYNGIGQNKREGDGQTPMGTYSLGDAFGTAAKPGGMSYPYQRMGANHYWIDDVHSRDYNQLVYYEGNPHNRWRSFERMNIDLYKYGVMIDYNINPVVSGKGSAIFMHVWRGSQSPTAGCVALSESNLLTLLRWLDQSKDPAIIITLESQFLNELEPYR